MKRVLAVLPIIIMAVILMSCATADRQVLSDGRTVYGKESNADLAQPDVISGRVTDASTGKPIKGAVVEIKNANFGLGYYRLETNGDGYYYIDNFIKHVVYKIEIMAGGYITYRRTEAIQSGKFDITMKPESILTGEVKDSAGLPMSGVDVTLKSSYYRYDDSSEEGGEGGGRKPITITTDRNGKYRFDKLPAGSYTATFEKPGYIKDTAQIRNIKSGESFSLPMQLFRPASVSGKIIIKGIDIPAANIDVTLRASDARTHSTASFQDGGYAVDDIKPGNYKLSLSHRGFDGLETPVIPIKEGTVRKDLNFTVKPKDPAVEVHADRYTFALGQKFNFNLKAFRLEKVKVKLFKVPMDLLLNGKVDPNEMRPEKEGLKIIKEWEETVKDFTPYEWREQAIEIVGALPGGGYCIEVSGAEKVINRKFFSVTAVGVVVKRSRESVLAYVTDMVTNKPIPNAAVILFDITPQKKTPHRSRAAYQPPQRIEELPIKIVKKGKTVANGIFHLPIKTEQHLSILTVGRDGSYAFCNTGSPSTFVQEKDKFFIYTDRPVYRAGDKVYFKIIGKTRESKFIPLAAPVLHYKVINTDSDAEVVRGTASLDEWGTYSSVLNLEADASLGTYEIRVGKDPKNLYGVGKFYVDQYRKPEFKIDITPAREYFTNRDTVEFKVEAKYLFGAPLKGASVKYRFSESKLRDTDTTYWWEEDDGESGSSNRTKLEGDKNLDDNGIVLLKLASGDFPYDREITLEATVVDKSNVSITGRATVKVGRGEFYIKINPVRNFFADGEKKDVEIRTVGHDGKPQSASVDVKVYRYIWKPWQRVYVHEKRPIFEKKVTTDAGGSARLELPRRFDSFGEFDITITGRDKRDNIITASRVIWVYSSRAGAKVDSRFKNLELNISDTQLEKPGEITALIKSRFTDAYVCLTIEGRDIYEKKVVKMNGNILPVKLSIKGEYAPNVFITATMQRNRALFTNTVGVNLPNQDTTMNITLTPDKSKYMPGEKMQVKIKATDEKGKPARADLSLGIVDEAVYLIRRDHTPKMRDFFYARISNWVLTNYSYPFTILAGLGKSGKVKVREKFVDTAYWKPDIRTNAQGMATVDLELPDNLTTFRLTARGHDTNGRVGEKKGEVLVTQDLIARIGKPRFAIEGDTVSLIGIVNSNTNRGLPQVATVFKIDGKTVSPDENIRMSLPAYGSARSYYTTKIPENRESLEIFMQATGDDKAKDALKIPLPIFSRGVNYKLFGAGDMAENKTVIMNPVGDTDDFKFRPEELVVIINPDPISQLLRATKYLAEYPYGCMEQTINRFLPALALKNLVKRKGLDYAVGDEKLDRKITLGLERIEKEQNDDGTWGWWSGDRGNEYITGYVLYAFHQARSLGYEVDKDVVNKGLVAVERILTGKNTDDGDVKPFLLYTYSLWEKWNTTVFDDINKNPDVNPYRLANMIKAMVNAKKQAISTDEQKKIARLLQKQTTSLKGMQKKDRFGVYWEPSRQQTWGWPGGNAEITAHVLSALIAAEDRTPLLSQIVASLVKRSKGEAWNSTKETATIFFALCKYLEGVKGGVSTSGNIRFKMDGKEITSIAYDTKAMQDITTLTRKVKLDKNMAAKKFNVEAAGNAGADVSFSLTLKGNLYFQENNLLSLFKSEERSTKALENGISLARNFYTVTRVKDLNNNEYMVPQDTVSGKGLKIGDELLVKVKFRAQDDFEYLILEDYLPAGFEVVKKNAYDDYQPYSRSERWDNRMVFFFTKVKKNETYEIAYTTRAELPGVFLVKPARMECMYEPSIQGWSVPAKFTVRKR